MLFLLACLRGVAYAAEPVPLPRQPEGVSWPTQSWPESPRESAGLSATIDALFEPESRAGPDTRALLAISGGQIAVERYASGFDARSRFQSWSVAKTFTLALVGILVGRGELSLDSPADVPLWRQAADDPRAAITLRQLLNMTTGLENGDGGMLATGRIARLLFHDLGYDTALHSSAVELAHAPGTHWEYSTGNSAIVSSILGRSIGGDEADLAAFMRRELAEPIGMSRFVPEFDAAGTFLGGSSIWASARDYARLGLLLMRDGVWDGRRLLPEGWVDFARTPAATDNNLSYGAHLWLTGEAAEGQFAPLSGVPDSGFCMSGGFGQYVCMFPDRDLIVVRLGEVHATTHDEVSAGLAALVREFER